MSEHNENVEYNENARVENGEHQHNERTEGDDRKRDRDLADRARQAEGRERQVELDDINPLPDEVVVDSHTKLAHEDVAVESFREADERETRAGEDFEGAPSAAELRQQRIEENDGETTEHLGRDEQV